MSNVSVSTSATDAATQSQILANGKLDAGMRSLDHYSRKLPRWRYQLRQSLLPIVRWETPYLAKLQSTYRTPLLDSYFAVTANLGTHTFFMTALPICFWCGYTSVGRALMHMLALGVFWSGFIKDMVCLPRPLSPPLQRITMSGSAALEYGFPSTHSTNAISVAFYFLYQIHTSTEDVDSTQKTIAFVLGYGYAISIILGRMYCGMHGFFDVVFGGALGAILAAVQLAYGQAFDDWIAADSWTHPAIVILALMAAVRFHPEPADNCPCFDDSVAFAGVLMGAEVAHWHFSKTSFAAPNQPPATVFFELDTLGWPKTVIRIIGGVVIIFLWRAAMKPFLLRALPPVFRLVEIRGFTLPRRYFTRASEYKRVPPLRKDDNVIPSASDIPRLLSNLRGGRKRGVSIGPQSEADAREFIAYREQRRRDSRSSQDGNTTRPNFGQTSGFFDLPSPAENGSPGTTQLNRTDGAGSSTSEQHSNYKATMLSPSPFPAQPLTPPASDSGNLSDSGGKEEERRDHEMFLALEKPRVRYDVEVVTKLVVYAGIAWLAIEGNPILFEVCGLGLKGLKQ